MSSKRYSMPVKTEKPKLRSPQKRQLLNTGKSPSPPLRLILDQHDGLEKTDEPPKGRGIVTTRSFKKGDFVVEYKGELISFKEAKEREAIYGDEEKCYMFFFKFKEKTMCIDATKDDDTKGRLINHDVMGNLNPKVFEISSAPRLGLVANCDIQPGDFLSYNYGEKRPAVLAENPWLKKKADQKPVAVKKNCETDNKIKRIHRKNTKCAEKQASSGLALGLLGGPETFEIKTQKREKIPKPSISHKRLVEKKKAGIPNRAGVQARTTIKLQKDAKNVPDTMEEPTEGSAVGLFKRSETVEAEKQNKEKAPTPIMCCIPLEKIDDEILNSLRDKTSKTIDSTKETKTVAKTINEPAKENAENFAAGHESQASELHMPFHKSCRSEKKNGHFSGDKNQEESIAHVLTPEIDDSGAINVGAKTGSAEKSTLCTGINFDNLSAFNLPKQAEDYDSDEYDSIVYTTNKAAGDINAYQKDDVPEYFGLFGIQSSTQDEASSFNDGQCMADTLGNAALAKTSAPKAKKTQADQNASPEEAHIEYLAMFGIQPLTQDGDSFFDKNVGLQDGQGKATKGKTSVTQDANIDKLAEFDDSSETDDFLYSENKAPANKFAYPEDANMEYLAMFGIQSSSQDEASSIDEDEGYEGGQANAAKASSPQDVNFDRPAEFDVSTQAEVNEFDKDDNFVYSANKAPANKNASPNDANMQYLAMFGILSSTQDEASSSEEDDCLTDGLSKGAIPKTSVLKEGAVKKPRHKLKDDPTIDSWKMADKGKDCVRRIVTQIAADRNVTPNIMLLTNADDVINTIEGFKCGGKTSLFIYGYAVKALKLMELQNVEGAVLAREKVQYKKQLYQQFSRSTNLRKTSQLRSEFINNYKSKFLSFIIKTSNFMAQLKKPIKIQVGTPLGKDWTKLVGFLSLYVQEEIGYSNWKKLTSSNVLRATKKTGHMYSIVVDQKEIVVSQSLYNCLYEYSKMRAWREPINNTFFVNIKGNRFTPTEYKRYQILFQTD